MDLSAVSFQVIASGDLADYTPVVLSACKQSVAAAAGVDASTVTVTASAGSVVLDVTITVPTTEATALQATISVQLADATAATQVLSGVVVGGEAITVSQIAQAPIVEEVSPPTPPLPSPPSPSPPSSPRPPSPPLTSPSSSSPPPPPSPKPPEPSPPLASPQATSLPQLLPSPARPLLPPPSAPGSDPLSTASFEQLSSPSANGPLIIVIVAILSSALVCFGVMRFRGRRCGDLRSTMMLGRERKRAEAAEEEEARGIESTTAASTQSAWDGSVATAEAPAVSEEQFVAKTLCDDKMRVVVVVDAQETGEAVQGEAVQGEAVQGEAAHAKHCVARASPKRPTRRALSEEQADAARAEGEAVRAEVAQAQMLSLQRAEEKAYDEVSPTRAEVDHMAQAKATKAGSLNSLQRMARLGLEALPRPNPSSRAYRTSKSVMWETHASNDLRGTSSTLERTSTLVELSSFRAPSRSSLVRLVSTPSRSTRHLSLMPTTVRQDLRKQRSSSTEAPGSSCRRARPSKEDAWEAAWEAAWQAEEPPAAATEVACPAASAAAAGTSAACSAAPCTAPYAASDGSSALHRMRRLSKDDDDSALNRMHSIVQLAEITRGAPFELSPQLSRSPTSETSQATSFKTPRISRDGSDKSGETSLTWISADRANGPNSPHCH